MTDLLKLADRIEDGESLIKDSGKNGVAPGLGLRNDICVALGGADVGLVNHAERSLSAVQTLQDEALPGWELVSITYGSFNSVKRIGLRNRMNHNAVSWFDFDCLEEPVARLSAILRAKAQEQSA